MDFGIGILGSKKKVRLKDFSRTYVFPEIEIIRVLVRFHNPVPGQFQELALSTARFHFRQLLLLL